MPGVICDIDIALCYCMALYLPSFNVTLHPVPCIVVACAATPEEGKEA